MEAVLLVAWIIGGTAVSSQAVEFRTIGACQRAQNELIGENSRIWYAAERPPGGNHMSTALSGTGSRIFISSVCVQR
jgi:hypothetical protein